MQFWLVSIAAKEDIIHAALIEEDMSQSIGQKMKQGFPYSGVEAEFCLRLFLEHRIHEKLLSADGY